MAVTTRSPRPRPRPAQAPATPPVPNDYRARFTFRCDDRMLRRLDEARWRLRIRSRTALITQAIDKFLDEAKIA